MTSKASSAAHITGKLQQDDEWLKSLEENLQKSSALRNQIVTLLESFEERLNRLDKTVVPLHEQTAMLQRKQTNIAKLLKTIDAMQQFYGRAAELESSIREGNASLEREKYIERMEQLAEAISFFSTHPTYQNQLDNMRLTFESGCCTLEKEFRNVVQADSIVADAALVVDSLDPEFEVIPTRLKEISTLRDATRIAQIAKWLLSRNPDGSLVESYAHIRCENMLRTLAAIYQHESATRTKTPTAMPSKPSALSLRQALKKATGRSSDRFGSVRDWRTSDETVDAILLAFGSLLALIQIETEAMERSIGDVRAEARIQRAMFARPLRSVIDRANRLLGGLDCSLVPILPLLRHINVHYNQLLSLSNNAVGEIPYEAFVSKVQSKCTASLHDFLDRLTGDTSRFVPPDGNVHQVTSNTLNYLSSLMEYRQTVTQLLMLSSAGANPSVLLPRLFARILAALDLNLKGKMENYNGDDTLASIFMLNNYNYIHNVLQNDGMFAVVCECNSEVRSYYRTEIGKYTNGYLQSWSRVVASISLDKTAFDDKQILKNALLTFYSEFDKLALAQKNYCFSDLKLSHSIRDGIKKIVLEHYAEFYNRINHLQFAKSFEKHLKYTPESLEIFIERLFDVTA